MAASSSASEAAKAAVFVQSEAYEGTRIKGPDFNQPHSLQDLLKSYETIGFQANGLSRAMELIDKMVSPSLRRVQNEDLLKREYFSCLEELEVIG